MIRQSIASRSGVSMSGRVCGIVAQLASIRMQTARTQRIGGKTVATRGFGVRCRGRQKIGAKDREEAMKTRRHRSAAAMLAAAALAVPASAVLAQSPAGIPGVVAPGVEPE